MSIASKLFSALSFYRKITIISKILFFIASRINNSCWPLSNDLEMWKWFTSYKIQVRSGCLVGHLRPVDRRDQIFRGLDLIPYDVWHALKFIQYKLQPFLDLWSFLIIPDIFACFNAHRFNSILVWKFTSDLSITPVFWSTNRCELWYFSEGFIPSIDFQRDRSPLRKCGLD